MKIARLEIENFMKCTAIDITPDATMNLITGANASGKTSIQMAIWSALEGAASSKKIIDPIRHGEDSAKVRLDFGDIIVERKWTKDGKAAGDLVVSTPTGAIYPKPQNMLTGLLGRLSIDPMEFNRMPPKEQLATLAGMIDLPYDPEDLERTRTEHFEKRTDVGRDLKIRQGQLSGYAPSEDLPEDLVSLADLVAEHRQALAVKAENDAFANKIAGLPATIGYTSAQKTNLLEEIAKMQRQVLEYTDVIDMITAEQERGHAHLATLVRPDIEGIEARMQSVESTNDAIRAQQTRRQLVLEVDRLQGMYDGYTISLNDIAKLKIDAIANAKMPIEGLAFDEDGITFNGTPFSQCSSAEQIKVSMAMAIALNGEIKIVMIRDGSLLDSDSLKLVEELAERGGAQLFVEVVDESGSRGIVIVEGKVAGATQGVTP